MPPEKTLYDRAHDISRGITNLHTWGNKVLLCGDIFNPIENMY